MFVVFPSAHCSNPGRGPQVPLVVGHPQDGQADAGTGNRGESPTERHIQQPAGNDDSGNEVDGLGDDQRAGDPPIDDPGPAQGTPVRTIPAMCPMSQMMPQVAANALFCTASPMRTIVAWSNPLAPSRDTT